MKQRIEWVDVLKGIAIILVVIGHNSSSEQMRFQWIYSFHMPLFFFLSGYVFHIKENDTFCKFVARKFKSLIIPYIVFSIISIWLYCTFVNSSYQVLKTFWFASRLEMGGKTPYNTSLWFLPSLFIIEVFYFTLRGKRLNKYLIFATVILVSVLGFTLTQKELILPMSLDWSMYYLLYFAVGNLFHECATQIGNTFRKIGIVKPAQYIYCVLC